MRIGLVIGFIDAAIKDPTSSTWSSSMVGDDDSLSLDPREGIKAMPLPPSGFFDLLTLLTMTTGETGLVAMWSESPNPVLPVPSGCFLEMVKDFGYGPNWVWCRRHVLVSPVSGKLSAMILLSIQVAMGITASPTIAMARSWVPDPVFKPMPTPATGSIGFSSAGSTLSHGYVSGSPEPCVVCFGARVLGFIGDGGHAQARSGEVPDF